MTFLELCQRLRQEAGISGTGPTTVIGQVGELKRVVEWIATSWLEIQALHQDWKFHRRSASWPSIANQATYTPLECGIALGTFGRWIPCNFRTYLTASGFPGEFHLGDLPYEVWRDTWLFGANRTVTYQPVHIAITYDDSLALGPRPPAGYTFLGDYYCAPVPLLVNGDIPALPAKHDPMLIVYRALMLYAMYESAPEVLAQGKMHYEPRLRLLENDQLPMPSLAGALC